MKPKRLNYAKRWLMIPVVIVMTFSFSIFGLKAENGRDLKFNFTIAGGYALRSLDDFGISKESYVSFPLEMDYSVFTDGSQSSLFGGIDISLEFRNLGLSSGFRYFPGVAIENGMSGAEGSFSTKLDLSTFVIPVELYYKIPVKERFYIKLGAGIEYYSASADYDYADDMGNSGYFEHGNLKDTGIGGHVTLGTEYYLNARKNCALNFQISYHKVNLDDFKGNLLGSDGSNYQSQLVIERGPFGEFLNTHPISQSLPPGYKPAGINPGGFYLTAGITFTLYQPRFLPLIWLRGDRLGTIKGLLKIMNETLSKMIKKAKLKWIDEEYIKWAAGWLIWRKKAHLITNFPKIKRKTLTEIYEAYKEREENYKKCKENAGTDKKKLDKCMKEYIKPIVGEPFDTVKTGVVTVNLRHWLRSLYLLDHYLEKIQNHDFNDKQGLIDLLKRAKKYKENMHNWVTYAE